MKIIWCLYILIGQGAGVLGNQAEDKMTIYYGRYENWNVFPKMSWKGCLILHIMIEKMCNVYMVVQLHIKEFRYEWWVDRKEI